MATRRKKTTTTSSSSSKSGGGRGRSKKTSASSSSAPKKDEPEKQTEEQESKDPGSGSGGGEAATTSPSPPSPPPPPQPTTKASNKMSKSKSSNSGGSSSNSKGWVIKEKVNGREITFTQEEALVYVGRQPTKIKGDDGKSYVLPPGKRKMPSMDGKPAQKQVIVLTSTKIFPWWNKLRQPRVLIKYNGPKPEPGHCKIVAPGIGAAQI